MSKLNMKTGLTSVAAMLLATSAFAEPPIQEGDTLESLSQVRIETTVNGQPGSLEQMGIPKEVIAQAIAQNAVIDLQAHTLLPIGSDSQTAISQSTMPAADNTVAQSEVPEMSAPSTDMTTATESAIPSDHVAVGEVQSLEQAQLNEVTADLGATQQQLASDVSSAEQQIQQQVDQQTAHAQHAEQQLQQEVEQAQNLDPAAVVSDDPTVAAQMDNVQQGQQELNAAVDAATNLESDAEAAAIPSEAEIDPNAQALPAEAQQDEGAPQLGDADVGGSDLEGTAPLQ